MSARVPPWYPARSRIEAHYIAQPYTAGMAAGYEQRVNHLLGAQLPVVHAQTFGSSEASTGTYRFLHKASYNARHLLFRFVPRGRVSDSSPGTIVVAGADAPSTRNVAQMAVASPNDLNERIQFRKAVTPDAIAEHTYAVSNVQLHSVLVFEVPRSTLGAVGTDVYLDREYAWPDHKFSDHITGAGKGHTELLTAIRDARDTLRRHWSFFQLPGVTINPAANDVWTTIFEFMTNRGRDLRSAADAAEMRFRFWPYVSAVTAGTWAIRIRDAGTADTAEVTAVNAVGWWDGTGVGVPGALGDGTAFQMAAATADSGLVIEGKRTAGVFGNTLTVPGPSLIEDPS